jgi:hypothetical protein
MKSFDKAFYATRPDLLLGLQAVESEGKLQYILTGMFSSSTPTVYFSAADIPDLGMARWGSAVAEAKHLVAEAGVEIYVERVPQNRGGILYCISLTANPTGFVFRPAGRFGDKIIIRGSVGAAMGHPKSLADCKRFWQTLHKGFKKVEDCYVGPEAYRLLEQGWRLTADIHSPPEFDLRI